MRRTVLAVLLALALPGPAAATAAGEALRERLHLGAGDGDEVALLAARIECVAYHRARIQADYEGGLLANGWNARAERLWRLTEALAAFEAAHIRPMIDRETQTALIEVYFPGGILAEGSEELRAERARRCLSFSDARALVRISG